MFFLNVFCKIIVTPLLGLTMLCSSSQLLIFFLMNVKTLGEMDKSHVHEKYHTSFIIGNGYIKSFIDCYYAYIVVTYIDLSMEVNKRSKVPKTLLIGKLNIEDYKDG